MTTYYAAADLFRAPSAKEAAEIGADNAAIYIGRVKAIVAASDCADACERGRTCILGCLAPGQTIGEVGCMPVEDAKKLGDAETYRHYATKTWLLYYRLQRGMTQAQLAEKSGVNIRQLQRVELGEAEAGNLTARNLFAIADALDVDPRALL